MRRREDDEKGKTRAGEGKKIGKKGESQFTLPRDDAFIIHGLGVANGWLRSVPRDELPPEQKRPSN